MRSLVVVVARVCEVTDGRVALLRRRDFAYWQAERRRGWQKMRLASERWYGGRMKSGEVGKNDDDDTTFSCGVIIRNV